jgi:hypothetical protein
MHDAMVRRIAGEERERANRERTIDTTIDWSTADRLDSWRDWTRPAEIDILVVHRDQLCDAIERLGGYHRIQSLACHSDHCLRLVWSWSALGKKDLSWCTAWLASGAIYDPASLQSWLRAANRNAGTSPRPPHSLLRGIPVPTL